MRKNVSDCEFLSFSRVLHLRVGASKYVLIRLAAYTGCISYFIFLVNTPSSFVKQLSLFISLSIFYRHVMSKIFNVLHIVQRKLSHFLFCCAENSISGDISKSLGRKI